MIETQDRWTQFIRSREQRREREETIAMWAGLCIIAACFGAGAVLTWIAFCILIVG